MDVKKIALGVAGFVVGVAALALTATRADAPRRKIARGPEDADAPDVGAVPGDSVTAPLAVRPADLAAAPVGMAETEKGWQPGKPSAANEHVPTDLLADAPPRAGDRAPQTFRPDPTAVPTAEEREALRPATGPAPTLVADRGSGFSEAAGAA